MMMALMIANHGHSFVFFGSFFYHCLYGCMFCVLLERKIFRRMYGPKYEDGEWKSRTNRELEELSKGENIVKWIIRGKG